MNSRFHSNIQLNIRHGGCLKADWVYRSTKSEPCHPTQKVYTPYQDRWRSLCQWPAVLSSKRRSQRRRFLPLLFERLYPKQHCENDQAISQQRNLLRPAGSRPTTSPGPDRTKHAFSNFPMRSDIASADWIYLLNLFLTPAFARLFLEG